MAVDGTYTGGLQLAKSGANCDQVRMHQFNQRPAEEKIEPDKGHQCSGIVEHPPGRFLHFAALLDKVRF